MKFILSVFVWFFVWGIALAEPPQTDAESMWISRFLQAQTNLDADEVWTSARALATVGGTNTAYALLPYLECTPAEIRARKNGRPVSSIYMESHFIVFETLYKIGVPLETCLSEIEEAPEDSWREKLLAQIGSKHHGQMFVSNVVARTKSEGGRWFQVEHHCIRPTTVSTNGVWPVSIQLLQTETGLSVTISNYLASALSIPGVPFSKNRNTFKLYTDRDKPHRSQEFGLEYDDSLDKRSSDWYCSIPSQEAHTFFIEWSSITNLCPIEVWSSAWQIRWEVYDDLHHGFLSNPIPMTSLPIHN